MQGLQSQFQGLNVQTQASRVPRHKRPAHAFHSDLNRPPTPPSQFTQQQQPQGLDPRQVHAQQPVQQSPSTTYVRPDIAAKQIPSLPELRQSDQDLWKTTPYCTWDNRFAPPSSQTDFTTIDQCNSSPKFARLSLSLIPSTPETLEKTELPLSLVLQPLAQQRPEEMPIPVIDLGPEGPPRCSSCMSYISPFHSFGNGGTQFFCPMCNSATAVRQSYFSPVDPSGRRVDMDNRPELKFGTVDYVVPREYWAKDREPKPIHWIIAVDVSNEAVKKGIPEAAADTIRSALYGEKGGLPQGAKVAIITFDRSVHFYNLKSSLDQPQMMVVPDVEEIFVPMQEELFVDPQDSRVQIETLLSRIESMFTEVNVPEPALGATVSAAVSALEKLGGKISIMLSSLPTWGPGHLRFRDTDSSAVGTEREIVYLQAADIFYKNLGEKCVEHGIGVDLFIMSSSYVDIATVGTLSCMTGGDTFFYTNFIASRDAPRLAGDFTRTITRETGYQAMMKVRCSNGLHAADYDGNFFQHKPTEIEFGTIDADKAVVVKFKHEGKLEKKFDVIFQSALLYTTASGGRRVRVQNIAARSSEDIMELFKAVDEDAVVVTMAKEASFKMLTKTAREVREGIVDKCVRILGAYRKYHGSGAHQGQLILPDKLRLFPLYILGLVKARGFRGGKVSSDMRIHSLRFLRGASATGLIASIYPRIFSLHTMTEQECFADNTGQLMLPLEVRASKQYLDEAGAYLLENGQSMYLYLGRNAVPLLLNDLFGPGCNLLSDLNPLHSSLPEVDSLLSTQVRNLLAYINESRPSRALHIQIVRQTLDGAELELGTSLIEDRNNEAQAYTEFLAYLHRQINMEANGDRHRDEDSMWTSRFFN